MSVEAAQRLCEVLTSLWYCDERIVIQDHNPQLVIPTIKQAST
jgi:hypothetical protein